MTKIYTNNTVSIYSPLKQISVDEDSFVRLTAEVKIIWINTSEDQRFLFYRWQQSLDGGNVWQDIPLGSSVNSLSVNLPDSEKRYIVSSIEKSDINLQLANFNVSDEFIPKTYLEFDKVYLKQNQYQYRCTVILYNNDLNTIESAASTDPIVFSIQPNDTLKNLDDVDIPWDPMNPQGIIAGGKVLFDADTEILLWDPNNNPAPGSEWRIIDVGLNLVLLQNNIRSGVLVGLPGSYGPGDKKEPRFMQLQNLINDSWNTLESWTSKIGDPKHVFMPYGGSANSINVLLNGSSILEDIPLGSSSNPTVIKPSVDPLTNSTSFGFVESSSQSFISVSADVSPHCCGEFGTQTITIPSKFSLPLLVTIVGSVDDDLMVNGQIINGDNTAGSVNYSFICNTRTFTVGGWNAQCCGAAYGYTIGFGDIPPITVSVDSRAEWADSGINLTQGQKFEITATGIVSWGQGQSGPDGIFHPYAMVDDRFQHEALLGKIGDTGEIFLVGSSFSGNAYGTGNLYFITNDTAKFDNSGSFTAIVTTSFNTNSSEKVDVPDLLKSNTSNILTIRRPLLAAAAQNGGII
jgi:hypothetical protein